eukprot:1111122-Pyramimonas_sp.AAC.1
MFCKGGGVFCKGGGVFCQGVRAPSAPPPRPRDTDTLRRTGAWSRTFLSRVRLCACIGAPLGAEGIYRSSLDTRKPQNPTKSEEYQGHLQGVLYII